MSVDREKFDALFRRARLETKVGGLVAEVWLMPFTVPAEIVSWGERLFVLSCASPLIYREALLTFTINPETGTINPPGQT